MVESCLGIRQVSRSVKEVVGRLFRTPLLLISSSSSSYTTASQPPRHAQQPEARQRRSLDPQSHVAMEYSSCLTGGAVHQFDSRQKLALEYASKGRMRHLLASLQG